MRPARRLLRISRLAYEPSTTNVRRRVVLSWSADRSMRYEILHEGWVCRPAHGAERPIAIGPRIVVRSDGTLLCSFMRQSELGTNDFEPWLAGSRDGRQWDDGRPVWPHLSDRFSTFVSISRDAAGRLYLFGTRTPIDQPGEGFWCDATQGLKQNELIWSCSDEAGATWSEPRAIPMPISGAAEAPGPLCVTDTHWLAVYAPYNTWDAGLTVDRSQIVLLRSADRGATWSHSSMLRFSGLQSGGAESWVVQLDTGRLVGTAWHIDHTGSREYPNAYAISDDGGVTWSPTASTGTMGQSTALTAYSAGRVLYLYNQRRHGTPGVHLAVARPDGERFGIVHDELVWRADGGTRSASTGEHAEWTDFSFGEPAAVVLPDGRILVVLWCIQPDGAGIRCVMIRIHE